MDQLSFTLFYSVGKSSFLKMRPTPVLEAASTKRLRPAPRSTATKRKVLMDDPMVLHGEYVYLYLIFIYLRFSFIAPSGPFIEVLVLALHLGSRQLKSIVK